MTDYWMEPISLKELNEEKNSLLTQLRATKGFVNVQFYRQLRSPRNVPQLLKDMKSHFVIWMDDESFIMPKKLPQSFPNDSLYRRAAASLKFESKSAYVYGTQNDSVARVLAKILCWNDEETDEVKVGISYNRSVDPKVPTTFLTTSFLTQYMETNPGRRLFLGRGCHLSNVESTVLASHPVPLDVSLECTFEDKGQVFVETLARRTTYFGTLTLHSFCFDKYFSFHCSFFFIPAVLDSVSQVALRMGDRYLRRFQFPQPLSSLACKVEYEVAGHFDLDAREGVEVVPPAVNLVFDDIPPRFHTQFLYSSGNLKEMGMIYHAAKPPSPEQQVQLLEAIEMNLDLQRLELGCFSILDAFWDALLNIIALHPSLESVVFWIRHQPDHWGKSEPDLHALERLISFMKENTHLDISFKCRGKWKSVMKKVNATVAPVRHMIRAQNLIHVSPDARPAVFEAALSHYASGEFAKISPLLSENVDLFCSLVGVSLTLTEQELAQNDDDAAERVPKRRKSS
ncbi:hypothetical protein FisN_2Hh180 [Fistulifera solaris]|jgi:hypothetical protein|uniref:Uncharacterized protein n=1 Tax=Fistulifera solaris TaxID=1519565 RepID=A0A1Z5KJE8_FISSO|nr:hypothetical protein FisN_2Hh180 [Fistulifera solaris]|eukprot:GAX26399.1 hypothetical protein FisN_2Hh180 [Fistulifera solaris]